jgi:hypothetical protein
VAGVRIRWRGVARLAAIVVVGLIALRSVPALLHAPVPPPLGRDVGLPKAKSRASRPLARPKRPKPHRRSVPDAPAATVRIGTGIRHRHKRRRHHKHRIPPPKPTLEPVESAPSPTPAYVPEPAPEPAPAPLPEPPSATRSMPGDGSQEFAPH